MSKRLILLLPPLLFASFVVLAAIGMWQRDDSLPSTLVGRPAPGITTEGLVGYPQVSAQDTARAR